MANFIAIDLGASGGRVLLGRWNEAQVGLEELHRFENVPLRQADRLQWDVESLWQEIKTGLARYAREINEPLSGIGVDSWAVDFALLDEQGHLLDLPYHYRDHRTDGMMEAVAQKVGRAEIFERTGIQFLPINTLYQLYALNQTDPASLQRAARLLMIPDLFHYWLSGVKSGEYTNATTTQFFSPARHDWDRELLTRLGIPTHFLPPVLKAGTLLGQLQSSVAEEVGLPASVPIITPATHDTASAVVGVPGLDAQSAYLSSGTWSLLGVETPQPVINATSLKYNFTNEGGAGGRNRLLKNIGGLWLLQECQRQWEREGQRWEWAALLETARSAPLFESLLDPDAPDFLSPADMPAAIREYCRRSGQPQPASVGAIVQSCLVGLALKYRWTLERLEELVGHRLETVRVVGGGSQNALLGQYTANAIGRSVVAGPVEATALGNIVMQAVATNHLPSIEAGRQVLLDSCQLTYYAPDPASRPDWEQAYHRFERLL